MDINEKVYCKPFHRYFDESYIKDVIIDDIINNVVRFFKEGKYEYIEPAQTVYRSLIYAMLKQKHFGGNFYKYLDDNNLVYDNMYFKKYSENKSLYDEILKTIVDVFFYDISVIEKEFNNEYFNNCNLTDCGCFIEGNDIHIINEVFNHHRYLITKQYLYDYKEEAIRDEYFSEYKENILNEYLRKGNVKITLENNTAGIIYSRLKEKEKFMIYYYLNNKDVNKFIVNDILNDLTVEYTDLNDLMRNL